MYTSLLYKINGESLCKWWLLNVATFLPLLSSFTIFLFVSVSWNIMYAMYRIIYEIYVLCEDVKQLHANKKSKTNIQDQLHANNLNNMLWKKKVNQSCNELTLHGRSKNKSLALNKSVIKLLQNTRFKFHSCLYVPDWACLITSRPLHQSYHRLRLSSILVSYHRHQDHFLPHWVWLGLVQR